MTWTKRPGKNIKPHTVMEKPRNLKRVVYSNGSKEVKNTYLTRRPFTCYKNLPD
jgi:hypothetical protein